MNKLDESVCIMKGRAGSHFLTRYQCLEYALGFAAESPLFKVVDDTNVKVYARLIRTFELAWLSACLSFPFYYQQRVVHHP